MVSLMQRQRQTFKDKGRWVTQSDADTAITGSTHWCQFSHNWTNIQWKRHLKHRLTVFNKTNGEKKKALHPLFLSDRYLSLSLCFTLTELYSYTPENDMFYTVLIKTALQMKWKTFTKMVSIWKKQKTKLYMNPWVHHGVSEWVRDESLAETQWGSYNLDFTFSFPQKTLQQQTSPQGGLEQSGTMGFRVDLEWVRTRRELKRF